MADPYFYFQIDGEWIPAVDDGGVYTRDGITINRGYANENEKLKASRASFTLANNDLRYIEDNPMSPYFEKFGQNTPFKITTSPYDHIYGMWVNANMNGLASASDSVALSITGDIDLRVDAPVVFPPDSGWGDPHLIAKNDAYFLSMRLDRTLVFSWFNSGSTRFDIFSTVGVATDYAAMRVTMDINNGAGGYTVTFYTAENWGDPWVQLGATVTNSGLHSIRDTANDVTIGNSTSANGPLGVRRAEIYSGIAGTLVASPDFTIQTEGDNSFADAQGNTWILFFDATIGYGIGDVRFVGELSDAKHKHNTADTQHWVKAEVSGITQRLSQGEGSPIGTALESWVPTNTDASFQAAAYWPLNEGPGSSYGNPLVGTYPLVFIASTGIPETRFGQGDTKLPWLNKGLQLFTGDVLRTEVEMSGNDAWEFNFIYACQDGADVTFTIWTRHPLGGNAYRVQPPWKIQILPSTSQIGWTEPSGTTHLVSTAQWDFDLFDGVGKLVTVRFDTDGSDTDVNFHTSANFFTENDNGVLDLVTDGFSATATGTTAGEVRRIEVTHSGSVNKPFVLSHLQVFAATGLTSLYDVADYAAGANSEQAFVRIERLCGEKGIPIETVITPTTNDYSTCGPQFPGDLVSALQETALAGMGLLFESRAQLGYEYKVLPALFDQDAVLTLDYSANQVAPPFEPVRNDAHLRNAVTAKRPSGGQDSFEQTIGRYKVSDPADGGVGRYEQPVTVNVERVNQLADVAAWLVHLGTWDEARYPTVTVFFSAISDALAADVLAVDIGDRIEVSNVSSIGRYDTLNLLVVGYEENWDEVEHSITFNCVPERAYRPITLDTGAVGRSKINSHGTTLTSDITSTATSIQVSISDSALWATTGTQHGLIVGGERMTVTAVSGASSPQTFTVTRSVNGVVKAHAAGTPVQLYRPATLALFRT